MLITEIGDVVPQMEETTMRENERKTLRLFARPKLPIRQQQDSEHHSPETPSVHCIGAQCESTSIVPEGIVDGQLAEAGGGHIVA